MGHTCHVCGKSRPNEAFSAKGHRIHVCNRCRPYTKTQEYHLARMRDEIYNYLHQKNISKKNQKRLAELCQSAPMDVAELAQLVLEVSRIRSHKRKRIGMLRAKHPALFRRLIDAGLIFPDDVEENAWDESSPDDNAEEDNFDWDLPIDEEHV